HTDTVYGGVTALKLIKVLLNQSVQVKPLGASLTGLLHNKSCLHQPLYQWQRKKAVLKSQTYVLSDTRGVC
ncbi:hypothetical protein, partial [Stieleria mannarensis]|uniref:hypothetical protein n=1 Tax=Stieleria mannarensis TaxID=2755585 RepID=UPI001C7202DD